MVYLSIIIFVNLLSYLSSIYLSKELSVNTYGDIVLLITMSSFISTISLLGRSELTLRNISQNKDNAKISSILSSLLFSALLIAIYAISNKYSNEDFVVLLILSFITVTAAFTSAILKFKSKAITLGLLQKVNNTYKVIVFLIVAFGIEEGNVLYLSVFFLLIVYFVFFSYHFLIDCRGVYFFNVKNIRLYEKKAMPFFIDGMAFLLYYQSALLIFGYLDLKYELAVYSLALLPVSAYALVFNAYFNSLVLSKFYKLANESNCKSINFLVKNIKVQLFSLPIIIATYLFLTLLLFERLFDVSKYPDLIKLSSFLVFIVVIKFFTSSLNMFMNLEENIYKKNVICIFAGVGNGIAALVLINIFGLYGAMYASIMAELFILVSYAYLFMKKLRQFHG
ncbi:MULTISPECIES: oligosaccharide flippase family protein [unclassified Vibrio]|uniref:oligosaccharide flippase family protein n=1 Tax=unclassified Vibrio TaxID=2614977 RepID=UPI003014AF0C